MSVNDPIADMLTRIRNAHMAALSVVEMPHSRLKSEIARVLKKEGFITDFVTEGGERKVLRVYLKYTGEHVPAIRGIERESTPGLRRYASVDKLPQVLRGLGVAIISTPSGVMTAKEAKTANVGGEVLCTVL
jgi:small subunit ribosomal protein S8